MQLERGVGVDLVTDLDIETGQYNSYTFMGKPVLRVGQWALNESLFCTNSASRQSLSTWGYSR